VIRSIGRTHRKRHAERRKLSALLQRPHAFPMGLSDTARSAAGQSGTGTKIAAAAEAPEPGSPRSEAG
jgi:hypothetical protein